MPYGDRIASVKFSLAERLPDAVVFNPGDGSPALGFLFENVLKASRQEVDVTIGYFPLDWLGVAIGYKGVFQDFKSESGRLFSPFSPSQEIPVPNDKQTSNYNGPIFGVVASAKIDDSFSLIGNAFGGYLFVACDFEPKRDPDTCSSDNSPYAASKVVLRYAPTSQLAVTLGYRVQIINNPNDNTSNAIDLTHGPVFGVNYQF